MEYKVIRTFYSSTGGYSYTTVLEESLNEGYKIILSNVVKDTHGGCVEYILEKDIYK